MGFRTEGNALAKDFAPLKRKSRLTGLDGEERRRPQRNAVEEGAPDSDASMRRRRELESYFKTRTAKRITAERAENADSEERSVATRETQSDRKPFKRDDERRGGGERRGGNGGSRGYSSRGGERGKGGERRGGNGGASGGNKPYLKGGKRTFTKRKGGDE